VGDVGSALGSLHLTMKEHLQLFLTSLCRIFIDETPSLLLTTIGLGTAIQLTILSYKPLESDHFAYSHVSRVRVGVTLYHIVAGTRH
jgi:hypothetical protein